MIKALAPRMRRGCWWVLLSIVVAGGLVFVTAASRKSPGKAAGIDQEGRAGRQGRPGTRRGRGG